MPGKVPLLSFEHVSASYGPIQALQDVSINIYEKEIVTLIGANGAGKSTLLMSLYGQPRISHGKILFEDSPIHHLATYQIAPLGIAIAPERRRIFAAMSVQENLFMGAYIKSAVDMKRNLQQVYALFPILHDRKHQRAGTLSGGEQQMLSMGRSLMSEPKLFLLDEPSLGLAPQIVTQLFSILKEIASRGTTILLVEQNAHQALTLADRGYVMVNGEIQLTGTGKELIASPKVQSAYLGMALD